MKHPRYFASDNHAPAHPKIIEAIARCNHDHVHSYGDDPYTERATARIRELLGPTAETLFVFNGTGANVVALAAALQPFQAVICSDGAHIATNECGAPEKFTGCKLITAPTEDGKLTVQHVEERMIAIGDPHHVQPRVISISQASELGTVYTVDEVRALADFAHSHGMVLHMDGARIANAAAALNVSLKALTADAGVDMLSFGGTKNGMLLGEAVVFFDKALTRHIHYIRKQSMQLSSKMRFIAAQFEALLEGDLWLENARHANAMASLLATEVAAIPGVRITREVQTNSVFAIVAEEAVRRLQEEYYFYVWNERTGELRWMTSFDTTPDDVRGFVQAIRKIVAPVPPLSSDHA
jgi:threonine aldolase